LPSSPPLERVTGWPGWLPLVRVLGPEVEGLAPLVRVVGLVGLEGVPLARVLTEAPGVEAECEPLARVASALGLP
jgi:hypothetical protein